VKLRNGGGNQDLIPRSPTENSETEPLWLEKGTKMSSLGGECRRSLHKVGTTSLQGFFFSFKSMFTSQKRVKKKIFLKFLYMSYHVKEPLLTGKGSQEKK